MIERDSIVGISSGTIVRVILFGVLVWLAMTLHELLLAICTAVVVASALAPFTDWLVEHRVPRILAALFLYGGFFLLLVSILYFFLPPLVDDLVDLSTRVPQYLGNVANYSQESGGFATLVRSFHDSFARSFSFADVLPGVQHALQGISGGFLETAQFVFRGLFQFGLVVVLSFYLTVQESGVEDFFRLVSPPRHEEYVVDLWKRSRRKIGRWMQGQLLLGILIGVCVYLGLTVFGVKYALIFAILTAIFEIIPVFGPVIAAVFPTVSAFAQSFPLGFVVLGFFILIQQFESHLIYPLVVRKIVGVPPLLVILALIVGGELAGFWGVVLAVPLAAVLVEVIADVEKKKRIGTA